MTSTIKRKVLTLLTGVFSLGIFQQVKAQFYSDFSGYTPLTINTGQCPTYSCMNVGSGLSGCTPGAQQWGRMGTPSPNGTSLTMVAGNQMQEGIFTNFNFVPGYTYRIHLGIRNYYSTVTPMVSSIKLYAASNIVQTPDAFYRERSLGCQEPDLEPYPNTNAIDILYWGDNANQTVPPLPQIDKIDYLTPPMLPASNTVVSDVYVDYTPLVANSQFALHPSEPLSAGNTTLVLDYVRIDRICDAGFSYTIDTRSPNSVTYEANNTANASMMHWFFGDGTTSDGFSVTHMYGGVGSYSTCLEIGGERYGEEGCNSCVAFCIQRIEEVENGCAHFTYTINSGAPLDVAFQAINTGSTYHHSWDFGDGTTATGEHSDHQFPGPGTYTVCHSERNLRKSITCEQCFEVCVGQDGSFMGKPMAVGATTKSVFDAIVYPNPAIDKAVLDVTMPEDGVLDISILDAGGRIVTTQSVRAAAGNSKVALQTDALSSGVYHVSVKTGTYHITRKLSIVK